MNKAEANNLDQLLEKLDRCDLSKTGQEQLNRSIKDDPDTRMAWIDHCLVEAMLESDDVLAAELASVHLPDNVVNFPGQLPRRTAPPGFSLNRETPRFATGKVLTIAALLVSLALVTAYVLQGLSSSSENWAGGDGEKLISVQRAPGTVQYHGKSPPTPASLVASAGAPATLQMVSFNRDIRPILADNCVECHGPDSAAREADLRLDREQDAVTDAAAWEAGESQAPIVRGRPDISKLIARIEANGADDLMPLRNPHNALSAKQIVLLRHWVTQGAQWQHPES